MNSKTARTYRTLDAVAAEHMRKYPTFALYHLTESAKELEPRVFLRALKQLIESRPGGLSAIARKAQVDREGLHRSLEGPAVPNWSTVTRVLHALRLQISFQPAAEGNTKPRRRSSG